MEAGGHTEGQGVRGGRTGCASCSYKGGRRLPLSTARLAPASTDKGPSSQPAVRPLDHRALGRGGRAKLRLWGCGSLGRGGDPRSETGRHSWEPRGAGVGPRLPVTEEK